MGSHAVSGKIAFSWRQSGITSLLPKPINIVIEEEAACRVVQKPDTFSRAGSGYLGRSLSFLYVVSKHYLDMMPLLYKFNFCCNTKQVVMP